jgi:hypothetical protein
MIVRDHFFDWKPGGFRRFRPHARQDLRAGPDFAGVGLEMNRGVDRFHRRVR